MTLHCPAQVVIVAVAKDASAPKVVGALAGSLRGERLAAVFASDDPTALGFASALVERLALGPPNRIVPGQDALQSIADLHRGETVLVLDRGPIRGRWVRSAQASPEAAQQWPAGSGVVDVARLELGDEGLRLLPTGLL